VLIASHDRSWCALGKPVLYLEDGHVTAYAGAARNPQ